MGVDEAQRRDDGISAWSARGQRVPDHVALSMHGIREVVPPPAAVLKRLDNGLKSPPVRSTATSAFLYRFASMT